MESVVIIELKQWSPVSRSSLPDCVKTYGGHGIDDYWHPSYQAYNYANIMKNFNEYIYTHKVDIEACSYLHHMPEGYQGILNDTKAFPFVHEVPCFLQDDELKLADFISKYVKKAYTQTLYEIDASHMKKADSHQGHEGGVRMN